MTPDGHFLIDRLPGVAGFYVASGCNVGGLSISPPIGEDLADWIVAGGERPPPLAPFRIDRFDGRFASDAELRPPVSRRTFTSTTSRRCGPADRADSARAGATARRRAMIDRRRFDSGDPLHPDGGLQRTLAPPCLPLPARPAGVGAPPST